MIFNQLPIGHQNNDARLLTPYFHPYLDWAPRATLSPYKAALPLHAT